MSSFEGEYRRTAPVVAALAALALSACTPPVRQYPLENLSLSCDEANRATYDTMRAMGFEVTSFEPAAAGRPGTAKGVRSTADGRQPIEVSISCGPAGATVDAEESNALLQHVEFKRAFYQAFTGVLSMHEAHTELEQRIEAGTAPASEQRSDLQVLVDPMPGPQAKLDLGIDPSAGGVLPVRVLIHNRTKRVYALRPEDVRLVRADRQRQRPLSVAAATQRLAGARTADGAPVVKIAAPELEALLAKAALTAERVVPGEKVEGFLYFPLAEYRGARAVLTDEKSGEAEGVAVEF